MFEIITALFITLALFTTFVYWLLASYAITKDNSMSNKLMELFDKSYITKLTPCKDRFIVNANTVILLVVLCVATLFWPLSLILGVLYYFVINPLVSKTFQLLDLLDLLAELNEARNKDQGEDL